VSSLDKTEHTTHRYDKEVEKALEPWVYEWVQKRQGSISAEHGLGLAKKAFIGYSRSETMIKLMKGLKNNTGTRTQLRSQHRKEQATGGIPLLPSTQPDFLKATSGDTSLLDGKSLSLLRRYHNPSRLHKTNFNCGSLKNAQPRLRWHITS
jgi:hypothetical protein